MYEILDLLDKNSDLTAEDIAVMTGATVDEVKKTIADYKKQALS